MDPMTAMRKAMCNFYWTEPVERRDNSDYLVRVANILGKFLTPNDINALKMTSKKGYKAAKVAVFSERMHIKEKIMELRDILIELKFSDYLPDEMSRLVSTDTFMSPTTSWTAEIEGGIYFTLKFHFRNLDSYSKNLVINEMLKTGKDYLIDKIFSEGERATAKQNAHAELLLKKAEKLGLDAKLKSISHSEHEMKLQLNYGILLGIFRSEELQRIIVSQLQVGGKDRIDFAFDCMEQVVSPGAQERLIEALAQFENRQYLLRLKKMLTSQDRIEQLDSEIAFLMD